MPPSTEYTIRPGTWKGLRDSGFVEQLLDILAMPKMMGTQPDTPVWRDSLFRLADAIDELMVDPHPRSRTILDAVKNRFPTTISSYVHPLSCIHQDPILSPALLQICHRLAKMAQKDHALASTLATFPFFEMCTMTWFVDTPIPEHRFQPSVVSCSDLFTKYGGDVIFIRISTKIGVKAAVGTFKKAFERKLKTPDEITAFHNLSQELMRISGFPKGVLEDKALVNLLNATWSTILIDDGKARNSERIIEGYLWFLYQTLRGQPLALIQEHVGELIQEHDLVDLCALGIYRASHTSTKSNNTINPDTLRHVLVHVGSVCKGRNKIIDAYARPVLAKTLELLRGLAGRRGQDGDQWVDIWTMFIESCGLKYLAVINAEADSRRLTSGLRGCSWYQCVLHDGEPDGAGLRTMLMDDKCGKVQYCSTYCQKRDWYDGGHKGVCKRRT